jgi:HTH DNA binding domain
MFTGKMSGDPKKDEESWFTPVWEIEDELEPPGPLRTRKSAPEPDYDHPLLRPLAAAQDAVARLDAKVETASEAVAEGLRARMSYLEAAGWLRHVHFSVHPWDLALRDAGLTASYGAAVRADRIETGLPATVAEESGLEVAPSVVVRLDINANQALRLARLWRRLGEIRSWRPVADLENVHKTLRSLGCRMPEDAEIIDWLGLVEVLKEQPALIRAGRAARDWMNLAGVEPADPAGFFFAACLWREKTGPIALPFWSAPERHHHRLTLRFGVQWMADYLDTVRAAAIVGLQELERLRQAEEKGRLLGATSRSRLPDAMNWVLRAPIVTVNSLAKTLDITPQAALGLLRQLMTAGIVRERTGRASWRAFSLT